MAREKLAGVSGCRLPDAPAGTYLSDCCRRGFHENFATTFVAMQDDGPVSSSCSEWEALIPIPARMGVRLTLQPAAQQNQFSPCGAAAGLCSRSVPEDVHAARRAECHNRATGKFQLRESLFGAFENIALPQTRSFGRLEHGCAANDSQRAFYEGDGAYVLHGGWDREQRWEHQCNAEEIHVDPKLGS